MPNMVKSKCQNQGKYVNCKQGLQKKVKTKPQSNIRDTRVKKDQMRECQKEAKQIGPKYMYHLLYMRPDLWFHDGDLSEEESITQTFFLPSICAEKCLLKLATEKDKFSILWRFVA